MLERWTWDSKGRGFESWPLAGNNLGQVVYTHLPLSRSSIIWYWSVGGDSLQLGRSGVTLAMRHRLQWCIHLRTHGLRMGDEHPPTLLMWYRALYPLRCEDRITWHWLHRWTWVSGMFLYGKITGWNVRAGSFRGNRSLAMSLTPTRQIWQPRDRATRRVSWNRAKCRRNVRRLAFD